MADWQVLGCFLLALLVAGIAAMVYDMASGYRAQKRHRERWVQAPCHRPLAAWMVGVKGHNASVTVARADGHALTDDDYHWIRERLGMTPDTDED